MGLGCLGRIRVEGGDNGKATTRHTELVSVSRSVLRHRGLSWSVEKDQGGWCDFSSSASVGHLGVNAANVAAATLWSVCESLPWQCGGQWYQGLVTLRCVFRARQHALHALEQQAILLGCRSVSVIVNAPPTPTTTSSVAWTPDLPQNGKEEQGIDVCCLTVEAEAPL